MNKTSFFLVAFVFAATFRVLASDGSEQLAAADKSADRAATTLDRQQSALQTLVEQLYAAALQAREIKQAGDAVKAAADVFPDADLIGNEIRAHLSESTKTLRELRKKIDKLEKELDAQRKAVAKLQDGLKDLREVSEQAAANPAEVDTSAALTEADAMLASGAFEDAMAAFRAVLAKDAESAVAKTGLALCFFEMGDLGSAEQIANEVLALDARNARAAGLLGAIQFRRGELPAARRQLQRAIKYDDSNAYNHNYLGAVYYQQGHLGDAVKYMQRAVELDPGYISARYNLALMLTLAEAPDLATARQHYAAYLDLGGEPNPELVRRLGAE